ncbi:hypothetical protein ACFX2K_047633 [Malus domestica]
MIENGRFQELQSIIDILPARNGSTESHCENAQNCVALSSFQRKKRQIFVFSTTITLSHDFRKKMKCSSLKSNQSMSDRVNSVEVLSERAGMRDNVAVIDLTNTSILANKLVDSFVEQLIVFGEMNMHGVLVADDAAARGLDIPGVRTVVHFQLPHSAEVDAHRSGRTARASADGSCALCFTNV